MTAWGVAVRARIDVLKPRQIPSQRAWYYLPRRKEKSVEFYAERNGQVVKIRVSAKKLLKEMIAIGIKP